MRRFFAAALPIAALLVASGCDVVSETPSITLPVKTATFRFEFSSSGRSAGDPIEVRSVSSVDLASALLADGYTKGEVLSATVLGVDVSRIQPVGTDLSTFSEVELALTTSGTGGTTIARSTSLAAGDDAELQVVSSSATSFVTAASFFGVITIVPASLRPNSSYVITATVRLRVEVEGV